MGKVTNDTLDGWHAWCLSEVMGIGRHTKEDGYTGGEANKACVWADYGQQTWSQTRAQNAKSLHRSIYCMEDSALPKKALLAQMAGRKKTNLLTAKYTPRMKGDDSTDSFLDKIKKTLTCLATPRERRQWKRGEKEARVTAALDRRVALQNDLKNTVAERSLLVGEDKYDALGSGSAYGQSLQITEQSGTETLVFSGQADRRKIRALKSGHMAHLKTNAQVKNGGWKHLAQDDKEKLIKCGCCCGGVQDMEHILTDCGMTGDAVEAALTSIESIRGEVAAVAVKDRLRAAFRQMSHEGTSTERRVRKVLGKLHDELRRVLSDQRTAIQTQAALPMIASHAPLPV